MDEIKRPNWDELFFRKVYLIASMSRDLRSKIGCVLVKDREVISEGFNSFPRGINDFVDERQDRPLKYHYFSHAEAGSIYNCARKGVSSFGSIAYSNGISCSNCTIALIQGGISEFVYHGDWHRKSGMLDNPKWKESCDASMQMYKEAKVLVREFNMELGLRGLCDGKIIDV